jgi:large subunit ribosomal protein L32e
MAMVGETRRLLRVRDRKGARFKRDGYGKKRQLSSSWRRPRGNHNKQRLQKKAKGPLPTPGYGSPLAVRNLHPSGFADILVFTPAELGALDPAVHAVRIGGTVGMKKRLVIQEQATNAGFRILNLKTQQEPVEPEVSEAETEEDGEDD